MTDDVALAVTREGAVWRAQLNRPRIGNALSNELVIALGALVAAGGDDGELRTLVFSGAGPNFCTGFDLSGLDSETDESLMGRFVRLELLLQSVRMAPFRTVAMAHGRVMGAGADLFAACDERVVSPDVSIAFPGAQFGVVLGTSRLARLVGRERAIDWVSSGTVIDAETAMSAGLATARAAEQGSGLSTEESRASADHLDFETRRAVRMAARGDHFPSDAANARDLIRLVQSLARVGLQRRIREYGARRKKAQSK